MDCDCVTHKIFFFFAFRKTTKNSPILSIASLIHIRITGVRVRGARAARPRPEHGPHSRGRRCRLRRILHDDVDVHQVSVQFYASYTLLSSEV